MTALDESSHEATVEVALPVGKRLISQVATIVAAMHRLRQGLDPVAPREDLGHAANFLYMMFGKEPAAEHARIIEQVTKQLNKLIDVIKVVDLSREHFVERELLLVKVRAEPEQRAEILRITDIFRGNIIDVSAKSYVIEVTGDGDKIRAFVDLIKPTGILEIVRSGPVALSRGSKALS